MTETTHLKSHEIASMLVEAAERLDPVDVMRDVAPQINLAFVYTQALEVWKASGGLIDASAKRDLRIAGLGVKAVRDQVMKNARMFSRDNDTLRDSARRLRAVAASIPVKKEVVKEPSMQYSSLGMRMHSLAELAGAVPFVSAPVCPPPPAATAAVTYSEGRTDEYMKYLHGLGERFKGKVPKHIPPGVPYLILHMPVVVTTQSMLDEGALSRSGLTWKQLRTDSAAKEPNVMHHRTNAETSNVVVFENQVVVAMRANEVEDHRGTVRHLQNAPSDAASRRKLADYKREVRKVAGNRPHPKEIVEGMARIATRSISKRYGPHVNGMDSIGDEHRRYFASPGNDLRFMWLVQSQAIAHIPNFKVKEVAFPWSSKEAPQHEEQRVADMQKRLKDLEAQLLLANKKGGHLNKETMDQIADLREQLHKHSLKPTPETDTQKTERLASQKREAEELVKKELGQLIASITELEKKIAATPKDDKKTRASLAKALTIRRSMLEKEIESIRERIRRRPNTKRTT